MKITIKNLIPLFLTTVAAATAVAENPVLTTGPGQGGGPHIRQFNINGGVSREFFAYDPRFAGGVRVAMGDVNADGVADTVVAAGPGGGPHVQIFDGVTNQVLSSFMAYDPGFLGGVFVASADVNGDGYADVITGPDAGGGPHLKVLNGRLLLGISAGSPLPLLFSTLTHVYSDNGTVFTGGISVAAGDLDGDGKAEIVVAARPGLRCRRNLIPSSQFFPYLKEVRCYSSQLKIYRGSNFGLLSEGSDPELYSAGIGPVGDFALPHGLSVAIGNVIGDAHREILLSHTHDTLVFVHQTLADGRFLSLASTAVDAYPGAPCGVTIATTRDIDGDGHDELVTGTGPGCTPHVRVRGGANFNTDLLSFYAYAPNFLGGVFVAGGR